MKKNDLEHYFHNRNIRQLIHYIKEAHLLKTFKYELLRQQGIINIYPYIRDNFGKNMPFQTMDNINLFFCFTHIEDKTAKNKFFDLLSYISDYEFHFLNKIKLG